MYKRQEYSTPVILYITAMILACGVLKRFFFRFITKNELSLSFGKQVKPLSEQIKEIEPECPNDKEINPVNLIAESVVKQYYMDNYEVRVAEIERKKAERQAEMCIRDRSMTEKKSLMKYSLVFSVLLILTREKIVRKLRVMVLLISSSKMCIRDSR